MQRLDHSSLVDRGSVLRLLIESTNTCYLQLIGSHLTQGAELGTEPPVLAGPGLDHEALVVRRGKPLPAVAVLAGLGRVEADTAPAQLAGVGREAEGLVTGIN